MLREPWVTRGQARMPREHAGQDGGFFCCSASCFWTSWSISAWRFCRTRLTMIKPEEPRPDESHDQADECRQRPVGIGRCPEAGDPVHQKEHQHPKDDPGDPSNHSRVLRPSGARHMWRGALCRSLGVPPRRRQSEAGLNVSATATGRARLRHPGTIRRQATPTMSARPNGRARTRGCRGPAGPRRTGTAGRS